MSNLKCYLVFQGNTLDKQTHLTIGGVFTDLAKAKFVANWLHSYTVVRPEAYEGRAREVLPTVLELPLDEHCLWQAKYHRLGIEKFWKEPVK